jgi:pseudoazurin
MVLKYSLVAALLAASFALAEVAQAKTVEIDMLNKDETGSMVFHPALVRVQPGDQVLFKAVAKIHMVKSIATMTPDGAKPVVGAMGADTTVTLTQEGVYGFECLPHYGMGMVALVVVGKPVNEAAVKDATASVPSMAKARFTKLFAQLDAAN